MTNVNKIVIAIDGYSSSGKSTMARALASRIGYRYIDSGAMYRAVTLYALQNGFFDADGYLDTERLSNALPQIAINFAVANGSQRTTLNGADVENDIRGLEVSNNVSEVAAVPAVRHRLVQLQQEFGRDKGIVMDGRDIGTTVFPDAELKIFVNASARTRAERRYKELTERGDSVNFDDILANIEHRDHIDTTRAESPLRRADDAVDLDNSAMTIAEQDAFIDSLIATRLSNGTH